MLQLKFKKAARLLATTQLPVSIISNSLGFEDQLAFSRTFKKFYNVSPTDYRSHLKP
ncbi:MAG: helix-turn-helix domain-containing protein [Mediterraneibacter faecis]